MINFENETYENIRQRMLNNISLDVDKRETSIADAAIAPMALELSRLYEMLKALQNNAWVLTAEGTYLDYKCIERGIVRKPSTPAIKMAKFNISIEKGSQFSTIGLTDALIYETIEECIEETSYTLERLNYNSGLYIEKNNIGYFYATDTDIFYKDGIEIEVNRVEELPQPSQQTVDLYYLDNSNITLYIGRQDTIYKAQAQCNVNGIIGNSYSGNMIPMVNTPNLTYCYLDEIVLAGTDEESDIALKIRYLASIDLESFGGNISSYRSYALSINGVGGVQVYPHYKGPGTVKLSIIDSQYNTATPALVELVQNVICPPETGTNEPSPLGFGMAVIGARVDIGTTTDILIDLEFDVELKQGKTIGDIENKVNEIFEKYLLEIRTDWGQVLITNKVQYIVNIYRAVIQSRLLELDEVLNISNLKLNNIEDDFHCIEQADYSLEPPIDIQQLPIKGSITINDIS